MYELAVCETLSVECHHLAMFACSENRPRWHSERRQAEGFGPLCRASMEAMKSLKNASGTEVETLFRQYL